MLLTLYDPPSSHHNGGEIAAPVVSQMLTEILPHLGIPSDGTTNSKTSAENLIIVPDVRNKTITEAKLYILDRNIYKQISYK